jgi:outer membrane protein OmpA-like peptidoglycan-associated protein
MLQARITKPMNIQRKFILLSALFLINTGLALSATGDVAGSKDNPLLKRYEGSVIIKYDYKAFDEYTVPLGPAQDNKQLTQSMCIEGEVTRLTYKVPVGRSPLEVTRNYENELKAAGYEVLFAGAKEELGKYGHFAEAAGYETLVLGSEPARPFHGNEENQRFLAARLSRPEGDVNVVLYAVSLQPSPLLNALKQRGLEQDQTVIQTDIIVSKPMESKMVTVKSEEMAKQISSKGSVALYGIYFDFNKADIKPESRPTIEQIAMLLKAQPKLKLLVVGHTDNVGTFPFNLDLSQRRANAVVIELVSTYGIDKDRLTPFGVSFASPVASNKTDEGRAKNRRVELVEN